MSSIVTEFDPSTAQQKQFTVPQSAANGALVFWNESNISLNLTFQDGSVVYLPAWYHKHKCGASGSVNIAWSVRNVLNSNAPPVSEIIVEAYDHGESFPADGPLVRQTNVGNSIPVSTTTNAIQNDGNPTGTQIIEATVSGASTSSVTLTNDGTLTAAGTVSAQNLLVSGGEIGVNATGDLIDARGTNTYLKANGGGVTFQSPSGNTIGSITSAGYQGNLAVGSMAEYSTTTPFYVSEGGSLGNGLAMGRNSGDSAVYIANLNSAGGIGFKSGGRTGTPLGIFKTDGTLVIAGSTYYTATSSFSYSAGGSMGGFDIAEMFPTDEQYPSGTIVCPGPNNTLTKCTHPGCQFAMVVSETPAFCAGAIGTPGAQPIAFEGRVSTITNTANIPYRTYLKSNGDGTVVPMVSGESGFAIGFSLSAGDSSSVPMYIRPGYIVAP